VVIDHLIQEGKDETSKFDVDDLYWIYNLFFGMLSV
jgi:hypothetical protein